MKQLSSYAFESCDNLPSLIIPSTVTTYEPAVFPNVSSVDITYNTQQYVKQNNGLVINITNNNLVEYINTDPNADIEVPSNIVSIPTKVFYGKKLRSIKFLTTQPIALKSTSFAYSNNALLNLKVGYSIWKICCIDMT